MLKIQNILFPTDFSECAEHAFTQARHLAGAYGATLHVVNVVTPAQEGRNNPMNFLESEEDRRRREGSVSIVQTQVKDVTPAVAILDYVDRRDIDVVVMGTHGRRGVDRLLLGSVAEEVVRLASCPVFTVRAVSGDVASRRTIRSVLAPVDFSDSARLALTYARELAALYGARLDVLHVVEEAVFPTVYGIEPVSVAVPDVLDRTEEALDALVREVEGADVPIRTQVIVGHSASGVLDVIDEGDVDLVVIATHGRTGIKRLLLGSVTEKVVRMAPCPVFTVKTFGKSLLAEASPPV